MRVGILGSGLMGGKLGTLFARAGSIVRKSSIRPSFESLDLTQRPKILEATYLAIIRILPKVTIWKTF